MMRPGRLLDIDGMRALRVKGGGVELRVDAGIERRGQRVVVSVPLTSAEAQALAAELDNLTS